MDYKVTSEIYTEIDYTSTSKPILDKDNVVSEFKFISPPEKPRADKDGDLIVSRKPKKKSYQKVEIEHSKRTALNLVGLQMWRGSLLLADWLLSNLNQFSKDDLILELAGGVGFTSIIASMFCPVICTDVDRGSLFQLMENNFKRNERLTKYPIETASLDFFTQLIPTCVAKNIGKIKIIIVAEVIYDDELTDAFVKTIEHLLTVDPSEKTVYLAVEKRFVFTMADCDAVAPCYEYLIRRIAYSKLSIEELQLDFPQYFEYDRVKELIFCKLKLK